MMNWIRWLLWRQTCPWCGGAPPDRRYMELLDMGVGPAGPCPHAFHGDDGRTR